MAAQSPPHPRSGGASPVLPRFGVPATPISERKSPSGSRVTIYQKPAEYKALIEELEDTPLIVVPLLPYLACPHASRYLLSFL